MASFSANLHVAGHSFPVRHCGYGVSQATHQRGRVRTKVRYEPVYLTLDVPENEVLLAWAAAAHKQQAASVVFADADGGSAVETLVLAGAYCVGYEEQFVSGDGQQGAYVCHLVLSDPAGFTMQAGGPATTFVAPAARNHGVPVSASSMGIGGAPGAGPAATAHAAAWAADRAKALDPTRLSGMYAAYVAIKKGKKEVPRSAQEWWGVEGKRGGARFTVEGCLGEAQADKLFEAQGHTKLNHGGQRVGVLDPPRGRGLDGVWKNAAPPPAYLITETKFTTTPGKVVALSSGGQLSDPWIQSGDRLEKALGDDEEKMREAIRNNEVGRRLLHIDSDGYLHEYDVDAKGKFDLSKPLKKLKV